MTGPRPNLPSSSQRTFKNAIAWQGRCPLHDSGVRQCQNADGKDEKYNKHSKQLTGSVLMLLTHNYLYFLTVPTKRDHPMFTQEKDRPQLAQNVSYDE